MIHSFDIKRLILSVYLLTVSLLILSQVPQGFNYQAAIRNAEGEVAANTTASLRMTIHQSTYDGVIVYQETHTTSTNQFGLVNLIIGEGVPDQGTFDAVPWNASTSFFMQIEVDLGDGFTDIGTQQLMSVPFAMASKKATDVLLDELNDVNTTGATIGQTLKWNGTAWIPSPDNGTTYVAGNGISISGNSIVNTGDVSSTNEIQSLTLNGTNLSLSNGGGSVTLPTGTTYIEGSGIDIVGNTISANDASATNEIQALTLSGANVSLSNGGGSITLPDASATNEIQSLTLNGTNLSLSNGGGSVTLPTGTTYTEGSGIDIVGNTISANDASATNEIQALTLNGLNLSLSNGGGSVTLPAGTTYTEGSGIDIVGNTISANDASATNEIQSLTLNGTNLTLSNGGGSVTLPTGTTYTAGSGISISGNAISNTGDTDASNDITNITPHSGDVTGFYNNLQIAANAVGSTEIANDAVGATEIASGAVGATELAQMGATAGQILEWDGLSWSPQTPATTADGVWSSNATNAWRLGGNIGIGTSTPQNGLHLHNKQGFRLTTTFTGSSFLDGFYIGQDSDNSNVYLSNFENGSLLFQTNFAERMRIGGDGNIGIGTQVPVAPLHLANTIALGEVYSKWTVSTSGHTTNDGAQIGLNSTAQMVIDQKENQDILVKRNGSTKVTVNSTGVDVNGELSSDDVTTGAITAVGADITSVNTFLTTTENLYVNSATGAGNRPLYANQDGQVYADNSYAATQTFTYPGSAFTFDESLNDLAYGNSICCGFENAPHVLVFYDLNNYAMLALHLPNNCTITKMTGHFFDVMSDGYLTLELMRCDLNGFGYITLASCQSTGSGGNITTFDNSVTSGQLDYENYVYVIKVSSHGDTEPTSALDDAFRLYSVQIEYTLPQ